MGKQHTKPQASWKILAATSSIAQYPYLKLLLLHQDRVQILLYVRRRLILLKRKDVNFHAHGVREDLMFTNYHFFRVRRNEGISFFQSVNILRYFCLELRLHFLFTNKSLKGSRNTAPVWRRILFY